MLVRMSSAPLRKDAARNRQRIVDTARRLVDEGAALQLNDIARRLTMGVATVYRHFPTPEALMEAVAAPGLEALAARAERAQGEGDPWQALTGFLDATVEALLVDPAIIIVSSAPELTLASTVGIVEALDLHASRVVARAHEAGFLRDVTAWGDLRALMCGIAHAAKIQAGDQETRLAVGRRYLGVTLRGLRA
jgi:AcrR family transcriptional regulator